MDVGGTLRLIAIDFLVCVVLSIIIGASAPRWPARWLMRDSGPLRVTRWDQPATYRKLRAGTLKKHLPEWGAIFGGESKSALPGTDGASLNAYLIEVRRAEWVHWLSATTWIPLIFFNPWYLILLFAIIAGGGNLVFVFVLRSNRIKLLRIVGRSQPGLAS
jgi:hypothetical protein